MYVPRQRRKQRQRRGTRGNCRRSRGWEEGATSGTDCLSSQRTLSPLHSHSYIYTKASLSERQATFYREVEAVHQAREVDIVPHNMQSYFTSYWQDERGKRPPTVGQSKAIKLHLQRLSEALEENGWTTTEEVGRLSLMSLEV